MGTNYRQIPSKDVDLESEIIELWGKINPCEGCTGNLPTFFMSIFVVPTGVIDTLERIRRKFIWSKEYDKKCICWVPWEKLISPRSVRGIGLGSIKSLNISLLAKWMWRLKTDSSALWANVVGFQSTPWMMAMGPFDEF
uniref:Reverse transcriptase zinc-binding domain-containing protein n=1 Tax=Lactuca sativa TaxID=4236 RepID=A0A9R1XH17_LACSA|nr:hypothetical protein LSAT_V11C400220310 [Lactuca sativa]